MDGRSSGARRLASAMTDTPGFPRNAVVAASDGSTMMTAVSRPAVPRASQPARRAPPILPQPTSTTGPDRPFIEGPSGLGFADRIEAGGGHRFGRILAAPHHVLEGRVEALALVERHVDQIFHLLDRGPARAAQRHRATEGRLVVLARQIEMPRPQALVGERQQLVDRRPAVVRHFEVERAGEMQGAHIGAPGKVDAVVAPFAGNLRHQLIVIGAVERPFVAGDDLFYQVEGLDDRFGGGRDPGLGHGDDLPTRYAPRRLPYIPDRLPAC